MTNRNAHTRLSGGKGFATGFIVLGLAFVLLTGLVGCATLRIEGDDDSVRVERQLGLLSVTLIPSGEPLLAEIVAVGAAQTWEGVTVGYYSGSLLAFPENDCRIVLWAEDPAHAEQFLQLIEGRDDVCIFTKGEETDEMDING